MKILYIINRFYPAIGGSENHVYFLANNLSKYYDITIYTSDSTSNNDVITIHRKYPFIYSKTNKYIDLYQEYINNFEVIRFKMLFRYWSYNYLKNFFYNLFNNINKYDVIHAHGYHISISFISFLITRIKKKKFILTAHDLRIPDSYPITAKIFSYIYDHSFGKLMILKSDKLIALTEDDYDFYKNLGAKEKNIVIIPNGIDIKKYFSDVDISSPILLYVGRIVDYKGIDKIIYLLPLLKKKYYNIKLYIVGNDYGYQSYVEELIDILKIKEHVYIFNNISQEKLIQLYKKSNIFVFPSQLEGFGIVLLEAMASRTLCIAYNIPGVRKVIKNDYGILVDTDSDLLLNISYYLNPDNFNEKLLILNKAQKYVKKYDISFIIESYVDLYEKI